MLCQRTKQVKKITLDVDILLTTKGLKNRMDSLKEIGLEPVIHRVLLFLPHKYTHFKDFRDWGIVAVSKVSPVKILM